MQIFIPCKVKKRRWFGIRRIQRNHKTCFVASNNVAVWFLSVWLFLLNIRYSTLKHRNMQSYFIILLIYAIARCIQHKSFHMNQTMQSKSIHQNQLHCNFDMIITMKMDVFSSFISWWDISTKLLLEMMNKNIVLSETFEIICPINQWIRIQTHIWFNMLVLVVVSISR